MDVRNLSWPSARELRRLRHIVYSVFRILLHYPQKRMRLKVAAAIRSANMLGAAIRNASYTQTDLARKTGLRQATISGLENGEGGSIVSLFKLCMALDLDLKLEPCSTHVPDLDAMF